MSLQILPSDGDGQNPVPETHSTLDADLTQELRVENISQELKARPQWVVWRYVEKPSGKLDKIAFQPNYTGKMARTNIPSDWSTFDKALKVYQESGLFDGIGYVFSDEDPYTGLDYDRCLDPDTGELHEAVSRQIEELGGYTEISPSGTGVKVIVRAKKPASERCSTKETPWGDEFAMYEKTRFFTITGRVFGGHREITEAQEAIDRAYHVAFGEEEKSPPPRGGSEGRGNTLTDSELIELASSSKNGERFRRHHHEGDATGYPSRSEADFAHLADLCFWTGGDEERMVELFARSALYLPEKGMGYVRRSARKACAMHQGGFFKPRKQKGPDEEVLELVEELERRWWDEPFPGMGGKTLASMVRGLISKGKRIGTIKPGEGLRVSISVMQLAEIVQCHENTIVNATRRAKDAGILRKDDLNRREEDSGAFILLDPRLACDTPKDTCGERVIGGTTSSSRPPVADLTTDHYRWRGPVGKGCERTLCALEAFGPQTDEELAERLGWLRARDLRTRYLEKLEKLGLIERRGGLWALVGDYREAQDRVRREPYSTVQLRIKRRYTIDDRGKRRRESDVVESGSVASEEERERKDRERHERQREGFRYYLEERRRAKKRQAQENREAKECQAEEDREIIELLNRWNEERGEADGTISELEPVSEPQVVDGVVRHDPQCGCVWCEDQPLGEEEVA